MARIAVKLVLFCGATNVFANPAGMTVSLGNATAQQLGSQLNVTVSQLAILNWSSFNIAAGETTSFLQPSSGSVVFNIIGGANPSQIFGNLNANGTVILANANGIYFGPDSMIKIGGSFIATTAPLIPDVGSGAAWQFTGMPPLASIVNYGQIQVGHGRSLFLIAEDIQNYGKLSAPSGNIDLAAGQNVLISDSPDGRGLSAQVQLPQGTVDNFGNITADAGSIALQAQVVNEDGIIQANSVQNQGGMIELAASDDLTLGANSQISANGDGSSGGSAGGTITLQSGNDFSDSVGSQISATGGSQGGIGGSIEVSAPNVLSLNSTIIESSQSGSEAGTFILDPESITLEQSSTSGNTYPNGIVNATGTAGDLIVYVNNAFNNVTAGNILLEASGDITLNPGTTWNLSSTGQNSGQLTMEAGGDITFGNNSKIVDANDWSVTMEAGYNFANNTVQAGIGNIYLNGGSGLSQNGTIGLGAGSVNLYAGESILAGSGSVYTTSGGSIFADALSGDINAGTYNGNGKNGDYTFIPTGANTSTILGGMSTANGGNVTLIAGDDIISVPTVLSQQSPGASGTYGSGNVTLVAGNQITGNFTLANGNGNIFAGVQQISSTDLAALQNADASSTAHQQALSDLQSAVMLNTSGSGNIGTAGPVGAGGSISKGGVTLSLVQSGTWNAWAANDIYINEVNNPNPTYNPNAGSLFNYAPNAAVNFWAGNAIDLADDHQTRASWNENMPPVYPSILTLNAGAGGITVDGLIDLYPSIDGEGGLQIITRDGGDLIGGTTANSQTLDGITMSDSGSSSWTTFATGHASTPLYLNNQNPVIVDVTGSIENFGLTVPTVAWINVVGNTYNFGFQGQNLSPNQTTYIDVGQSAKDYLESIGFLNSASDGGLVVGGNITYRGDLTSQTLSSAITSTQFGDIISGAGLAGTISYDPASGTISYIGVMSAATENFLLNPEDGILTGNQLSAWQACISQLYTASQSASLGANGLFLAGPGSFNINANTIDLGISGGIAVLAPDAALAAISPYGANINVTTTGNLEMTTSVIADEGLLGGINLNVGGTLDVGGELTPFGDPDSPKGIFTTSGGNISVIANDDVNVEGSRIAAYDGGNITIESLNGSVNAGTGGAGYVTLSALEIDPATGELEGIPATIPGSGILATTVPGSDAQVGNILIDTPNGSITANQGGVVQLSFDGANASQAVVYLLAGYQLLDAQGQNPLTATDLSAADKIVFNPVGSQYAGTLFGTTGDTIGELVNVSANENIDASGSGVIAQSIVAADTGEAKGLFVGFNNVTLNTQLSGPLVLFGHTLDFTDPDDNGPTPILLSPSPVSVNGLDVNATAAISQAPAAEVATTADTATTVTAKTDNSSDDDDEKKKNKQVALAQKVSRVTVTLPAKNNSRSQNQNSNPQS